MTALLITIALLAWSGIAGAACISLLRARVPASAFLPLSIGTGLGAAGVLVSLLGVSHKLYAAWIFPAFALALVLSAVILRRMPPRRAAETDVEKTPLWFHVVFIGIVLIYFVQAFLPPTILDVLVYHLALPKIYAQAHGLVPVPSNAYSFFPQNMEMLYTLGMLAHSWLPANFIHLAFGVLTALIILSLGRRVSPAAARIAALIFLAHPLVAIEAASALVDLAATFFVAAVLLLLLEQREDPDSDAVLLAALIAGMAAAVKWSAGIYCAPLLFVIAVRDRRPARLAGMLLLCAAPLLVWLVRNFQMTGNPVYPMLPGLFSKSPAEIAIARHIQESIRQSSGLGRNAAGFFTTLWNLTMHEWKYGGPITPVFLLFIPFVFLKRLDRTRYLLLAVLALSYAIWYCFLPMNTRLFMPMFPALALLAAAGYSNLSERGGISRFLARGALSVCFLLFAAVSVAGNTGFLTGIRSLASSDRASYLRANVPSYPITEWADRNLPRNARVLLVGAFSQTYYLDRPAVIGAPRFQNVVRYDTFLSANDMYRGMRELDVTHVLSPDFYTDPKHPDAFNFLHPPRERKAVRAFIDDYLIPIHRESGFTLYEIRRSKSTR